MNEKKNNSGPTSDIDIEDLNNLEDELNNLANETSNSGSKQGSSSGSIFGTSFFNDDGPSVRFDDTPSVKSHSSNVDGDGKTWDGFQKFNNIPVKQI